jgi:AraC family transcriptional regulator
MEPRLEALNEKLFVGKNITMSLANNRTGALWQSFMPERKVVTNNVGPELYSIEIYPPNYFDNFSLHAEFEKWAAVEVTDFDSLPDSMQSLRVPSGLYAVFIHRGPASSGPKTYGYILTSWLPNSEYALDARPHFAVMNEKYKGDDPDSEEEFWIPVKPRI